MVYVRCPHCNARIKLESNSQKRTTVFESSARSPLRQTVAPPLYPPPVSITSPTGLPSMESHVHVPVNQALITGCLFAPVVILTVSSVASVWLTTGGAILIGGVAGGIALFGMATYQWHIKTAFYDSLLQTVETELGIDLDGDGEVGPPQVVKVEVKSEDGNRWQFADLPGKPEALQDFAKRVLMGQGFTDATGKLAGLTQAQVQDLRVAFVDRGWARWNHPTRKQQSIDLRQVGKSILRAIKESPTLSPPAGA